MIVGGKDIKTTNDATGKFVFNTSGSEVLIEDLTNATQKAFNLDPITNVTITSPVFNPLQFNARATLFDVKGATQNLDQINLELQRRNHDGFPIRLIANNGNQFTRIDRGVDYGKYPKFIVISILTFNLYDYKEYMDYHDCMCYISLKYHKKIFYYLLQIHTLEVLKWDNIHKHPFTKREIKNFTSLDFWMAFFSDKTSYKELEIMASQSTVMSIAKEKIDLFVQDKNNLKAYNQADEVDRIQAGAISFAAKEAANDIQVQIATNMLRDNKSINEVAKYSELPINKVKELKTKLSL